MDASAIKELYASTEAVRIFCDHMAGRDRNQGETKLNRILKLLENEGNTIRKPDMIAAFRELERVGCGQYVVGRHRWPSRFVWSVSSRSTCQLAQSEAIGLDDVEKGDGFVDVESEELEHKFNLRADFQLSISLPIDLSVSEADRLAAFVKSLPLEEFQE